MEHHALEPVDGQLQVGPVALADQGLGQIPVLAALARVLAHVREVAWVRRGFFSLGSEYRSTISATCM